jgi:hypothetical protein
MMNFGKKSFTLSLSLLLLCVGQTNSMHVAENSIAGLVNNISFRDIITYGLSGASLGFGAYLGLSAVAYQLRGYKHRRSYDANGQEYDPCGINSNPKAHYTRRRSAGLLLASAGFLGIVAHYKGWI